MDSRLRGNDGDGSSLAIKALQRLRFAHKANRSAITLTDRKTRRQQWTVVSPRNQAMYMKPCIACHLNNFLEESTLQLPGHFSACCYPDQSVIRCMRALWRAHSSALPIRFAIQ